MDNYRLDKTCFSVHTFEEADNNKSYWLQREVKERLRSAWYLISCAYGFPLNQPPKIDKTVFSMRKHIHINDLIKAKKASNRPKDQDDIEHLI